MFFTFFLVLVSAFFHFSDNNIHAADLLEQAFKPAMTNETIVNLWAGKNAVGNEVLRQWVVIQEDWGLGCFVQGNKVDGQELKKMVCENQYQWIWDSKVGGDDCTLPNGSLATISNNQKQPFCEEILWGDWKAAPIIYEAPLIVRITKFLLRITMVLAVTMVIFNGIMWIIESAKWAEVKNAKQNIILIVVGIFIALMSLWIINLISSLTMSSLWSNQTESSLTTTGDVVETTNWHRTNSNGNGI